jgi:hypothetical protein
MIMRTFRVLRVLLPFLLALVVVAVLVLVFTARPNLEHAKSNVNKQWAPLERTLTARYFVLATANASVHNTPGPVHQLVPGMDAALSRWSALKGTHAAIAAKVQAANTLESLGRRLVGAARRSPRVQGDARAKIDAYATAAVPPAAAAFDRAVRNYQRERTGPAKGTLASLLGYDEIVAYDMTGST